MKQDFHHKTIKAFTMIIFLVTLMATTDFQDENQNEFTQKLIYDM
ncbi:unnamed protein product [Paramecium pentaurelia]|uniref:Uncharacterized protein n=1 Tax=Paramecium pentaurelia TaxID=43138 RepID=A0A8S1X712_9CILI|nr:unnamed protein product [Paramecium pentaurelia]